MLAGPPSRATPSTDRWPRSRLPGPPGSDELVVIDYKTDKDVTTETAEAHALEKHSGQAEIYTHALAAATGYPVREVTFVYCKAGVEVRLRDGAVVGTGQAMTNLEQCQPLNGEDAWP